MMMRFMMMVKHAENQGAPPKELMDAIAGLDEQARKEGRMVANGGLAPLAASTRVRVSQGKLSTLDGPFAETREVVGGFAILECTSKQEAVEGAQYFMELHRKYWPGWEGETEIRQVFRPEDFQVLDRERRGGSGAIPKRQPASEAKR
jgi:hypothetical protein